MNPYIKTPLEIMMNKDMFTKQKLFPSSKQLAEDKARGQAGKSYLYSRGFKYYALKNALRDSPVGQSILKTLGIDKVELDKRGNPVTTSDKMVVVDRLFSTLLPFGIIDKVYGTMGKIKQGRVTPKEALAETLFPVSITTVSPEQEKQTKVGKARKGFGQ
jgi:hypothetical protein